MAKSNNIVRQKRGRGRPPTGTTPTVTIRLPAKLIVALDKVAVNEGISRSDAIRSFVELGLKARVEEKLGKIAQAKSKTERTK